MRVYTHTLSTKTIDYRAKQMCLLDMIAIIALAYEIYIKKTMLLKPKRYETRLNGLNIV